MGIRKRKTTKGESSNFHYSFMYQGKTYCGVCVGCKTEDQAVAFEKKRKAEVKEFEVFHDRNAFLLNYNRERFGGDKILLSNAFDLYLSKPASRKCGEKQIAAKQSYWRDFCAFMAAKHPDVTSIDGVARIHGEEYIGLLTSQGRFIGEVSNGSRKSYNSVEELSASTINVYHKTLKSIFHKLMDNAGMVNNPFDFEMMRGEVATRDVFTEDEISLMLAKADSFIRAILLVGTCTGLSEGDICMLRWSEIQNSVIKRRRHKTKTKLEIPITPPLESFLEEQREISGQQEFVLPEHAEMYQNNPSGISSRFKRFLKRIGISSTTQLEKRSRASSTKDVHSLRHTFATMSSQANIPVAVVQSLLGHKSPEMTARYQAHTSTQALNDAANAISSKLASLMAKKDDPVALEKKRLLDEIWLTLWYCKLSKVKTFHQLVEKSRTLSEIAASLLSDKLEIKVQRKMN